MTTKEKIAVMQAYEDGKKIQVATNGEEDWEDFNFGEPMWDWECCDYRIKPEEEKPVRMTNRQLAEWCVGNNGQVRHRDSYIRTYHNYSLGEDDVPVRELILIRPWGSDEWIEPTVDIYNRDCKGE